MRRTRVVFLLIAFMVSSLFVFRESIVGKRRKGNAGQGLGYLAQQLTISTGLLQANGFVRSGALFFIIQKAISFEGEKFLELLAGNQLIEEAGRFAEMTVGEPLVPEPTPAA